MKNSVRLFSLFVILGLSVAILFNSCQNTSEEIQPTIEQMPHSMGCDLLPVDLYNAIPVAETPNIQLKATVLDLNVPPVGNQGGEGSCVAWGTTYAGRSIAYQAANPGTWSKSVNIFSPEFVYNQIKATTNCGSGSYITRGLDLLVSNGVCLWNTMPYTDVSCSTMPTAAQNTEAANYKINGYSRVTISTTNIKAQLAIGKAVIVGGQVNKAYQYLTSGSVLKAFKKPSLGGHCYIIVGYDDNKQAFKFMNSWGTTWATNGFGYISYTYIGQWISEAYVIN